MQRASLLALWGGYVLFGLVYTTHIYSHNYYSLPLIPVVALSLGLVAGVLGDYLRVLLRSRVVQVATASLLVATMAFGVGAKAGNLSLPRPPHDDEQQRIEIYRHIGELVHHSSRALVVEWTAGLWYYGWVSGRYWPNHWDLEWQVKTLGLQPMSASERFATTDTRYWPAVGAIKPTPSVFIVLEPIELALEPDLSVYLSGFPVLAQSPDYVIFNLTRRLRTTAGPTTQEQGARATTGSTQGLLHRFPPKWQDIEKGMTRNAVLRTLGKPHGVDARFDLSKPFESWFYGVYDEDAIVFVNGKVFVKAAAACCCCPKKFTRVSAQGLDLVGVRERLRPAPPG
jgi:hypothetical protein